MRSVPHEDRRDYIGVGGRDPQQCPRRTLREAAAAFPVPKRFAADSHHVRELSARLVELRPNLTHIHRLELPPIARSRPEPRPAAPEYPRHHQRILDWITARMGPYLRLTKNVAASLQSPSWHSAS
jgi:hypothetical protein